MIIEEGKLYFIKDKFIEKYNKRYNLMKNKKDGNRPCYFCFRDNKVKEIIWFVPMSSKYDKYKKIEEYKIDKFGKCYNYVFDTLIGKKQVFLIQNIFPTLEKYIEGIYVKDKKEVFVPKKVKKEIILKSKIVIRLAFYQDRDLTFSNIKYFYQDILKEINNINKKLP